MSVLYNWGDDFSDETEVIILFLPFTSNVYDLPFTKFGVVSVANIILFFTVLLDWITLIISFVCPSYTVIS